MSDQDRPPPGTLPQAAGQVATDVVGSLKGNPILLVLVLFNAAFVAMVYYTARDNRIRQGEMVEHLMTNQAKMQEMLGRCSNPRSGTIIIPPATDGGPPS